MDASDAKLNTQASNIDVHSIQENNMQGPRCLSPLHSEWKPCGEGASVFSSFDMTSFSFSRFLSQTGLLCSRFPEQARERPQGESASVLVLLLNPGYVNSKVPTSMMHNPVALFSLIV